MDSAQRLILDTHDLSDITHTIESILTNDPYLIELFDQIKNDQDSIRRISSLPQRAEKCNKKFDTNYTEFDLMRHALIHTEKEWIRQVEELLQEKNMPLAKRNIKDLYEQRYLRISGNVEKQSKRIVSLLTYTGFIQGSAVPGPILRFLEAIKADSTTSDLIKKMKLPVILAGECSLHHLLNGRDHEGEMGFSLINIALICLGVSYFGNLKRRNSMERAYAEDYVWRSDIKARLRYILGKK